ncbi:LIM domain-binding protein 2 [Holothuria leucospilota]|uniref:LIM domain-binding protein 2 n=1 Tax=Holothuria leucospilota TaxID=206669 RepID=A0A9Q0YNQ2_HOLLE|nr:LIM domain-binding protein 2 [Holothuria leucospilota]
MPWLLQHPLLQLKVQRLRGLPFTQVPRMPVILYPLELQPQYALSVGQVQTKGWPLCSEPLTLQCVCPWQGWRQHESDNLWWDAFATEFFEDDAILTLAFCLEDGPKRYSKMVFFVLLC